MAIISFKTENFWDDGKKVESIQKQLLEMQRKVNEASGRLRFSEDVMLSYDEKAVFEARKLADQAHRCGLMASYYFFTAETFEQVERAITGSIINHRSVFGSICSKSAEIYNSINSFVFDEEVRLNHEMKNRVQNIIDSKEKYSKENWEKLTVDERKNVLIDLWVEVSREMGTNIEVFGFYTKESEPDNADCNGYYRHSEKKLAINADFLTDEDSYRLLSTVVHEARHAYQHDVMDNPEKYNGRISQQTIDQWRNNDNNYKDTDDGYTYEEYVCQPLEYDAMSFADQDERFALRYNDGGIAYIMPPEYDGGWKNDYE